MIKKHLVARSMAQHGCRFTRIAGQGIIVTAETVTHRIAVFFFPLGKARFLVSSAKLLNKLVGAIRPVFLKHNCNQATQLSIRSTTLNWRFLAICGPTVSNLRSRSMADQSSRVISVLLNPANSPSATNGSSPFSSSVFAACNTKIFRLS